MLHMMAVADWFLDRTHFPDLRDKIRGRTFILAVWVSIIFHTCLGILLPPQRGNFPFLYLLMSQITCLIAILSYTRISGNYRVAAVLHFIVLKMHMAIVMYNSQSLHSIYLASMGTDVVIVSFVLGLPLAIPLVMFQAGLILIMIFWNSVYAKILPFQLELNAYAELLAFSLIMAQLTMIFFSWLYHESLMAEYARLQRERSQLFRSARTFDLSRMLGELNHHMNNPLSIIHAQLYRLAQQVRRRNLVAAERDLTGASNQALKKIRFMVEHLKVLAAPESQEQEAKICVRNLCLHILTHFQENFRLRGIALQFADQTMNMSFTWRQHELFTILVAVIQNAGEAVEACAEKRVTIRIERHQQWLIFVVSDSGPGIPEDQRSNLFKPFHSTKKASQHLGLSLLSSKAMLDSRGGYINCENVSDGCSFQIGLPLGPVNL